MKVTGPYDVSTAGEYRHISALSKSIQSADSQPHTNNTKQ